MLPLIPHFRFEAECVPSEGERMFGDMALNLTPRRQGDLGELSAIEWLSWQGATVFVPLGHSPDVDLIADFGSGPVRIEVKTAGTFSEGRWRAMIATLGGNQSWNGVVKYFEPSRCDYLFVHVGDGRRWFIPTHALECRRGLSLGGARYAEYEIEPGRALHDAVPLRSRLPLGECQSGQMEGAVNASAMPTQVRILPPPSSSGGAELQVSNEATVWGKRRVTLPRRVVDATGIAVGDRLRVRADGPGRIVIERIELPAPAQPELPAA